MKGIYIIVGIAVLGFIALMLFSKKNTAATANNGQPAEDQGGGFGTDFGLNFGANFGSTTRQAGQSFSNWFNNRQQQRWGFNTNLF